ncbi:hypothetical protein [Ornithinimicrobium kibberense]|uniref:hypothetical protein n=1 Tax=Ornithinimicrobium kibberense TaxID=282060 RepID=UPI0036109B16
MADHGSRAGRWPDQGPQPVNQSCCGSLGAGMGSGRAAGSRDSHHLDHDTWTWPPAAGGGNDAQDSFTVARRVRLLSAGSTVHPGRVGPGAPPCRARGASALVDHASSVHLLPRGQHHAELVRDFSSCRAAASCGGVRLGPTVEAHTAPVHHGRLLMRRGELAFIGGPRLRIRFWLPSLSSGGLEGGFMVVGDGSGK